MILDQVVRRKCDLIESEIDGEIVALHVDSGMCFGFNSTATRVWNLIEAPKSVGHIRKELMAEFNVDAETCDRQLSDLLEDLKKNGLISVEAAQ